MPAPGPETGRAEGSCSTAWALSVRLRTKPAARVGTLSSSLIRAKVKRNHTPHQITAKAPALESLRMASFFSRGAWEARASTVSQ